MIRRLFRIFGFEAEYSAEYSDNSKVFFSKKKRDDYSEYSVSTPNSRPSIPIIQFFFLNNNLTIILNIPIIQKLFYF